MDDWTRRYFGRIGIAPPTVPDRPALDTLVAAHRFSIPFENLDIPLGRGVSVEPEAVTAKIVDGCRGGYCFEQNGLFLRVLLALGYDARPLLGRVWLGSEDETPARTHTINLVRLGEEELIVDVGFGGSFAPVLALVHDRPETAADGVRHRLVEGDGHGWMLERDRGNGWARQYSFGLDPVWPVDLEVSNHWTATRPGTRFTTLRVVSMPLADGFVSLVDRTLTVSRGGTAEVSEVADPGAYQDVLAERFGIRFGREEVAALGLF